MPTTESSPATNEQNPGLSLPETLPPHYAGWEIAGADDQYVTLKSQLANGETTYMRVSPEQVSSKVAEEMAAAEEAGEIAVSETTEKPKGATGKSFDVISRVASATAASTERVVSKSAERTNETLLSGLKLMAGAARRARQIKNRESSQESRTPSLSEGGGEPPEEPPEARPAGGEPEDPEEREPDDSTPAVESEASESIEDEARREYEKDMAWREHRRSTGTKDRPSSSIPREVLEQAAAHHIPEEYLRLATTNPNAAHNLRTKYGIDWGVEPADAPLPAGREITAEEIKAANKTYGIEITPGYINFARAELARGNLRPADALASFGIDLIGDGSRMEPADPVVKVNEIGRVRRQQPLELMDEIEHHRGAVRRSLKRPGQLPGPLKLVPFSTTISKKILAWRVTRKEMAELSHEAAELHHLDSLDHRTPDQKERYDELLKKSGSGQISEAEQAELESLAALNTRTEAQEELYKSLDSKRSKLEGPQDNGFLGIGANHYKHNIEAINMLDESIKAHRKQLSFTDHHNLRGADARTKRRDLAYRIYDARKSVDRLKHLEIQDLGEPMEVHNHEEFKRQRKAFRASVLPKE